MATLLENTTSNDIAIPDLAITVDANSSYDLDTKLIFDRFSSTDGIPYLEDGTFVIRDDQGTPLPVADAVDAYKGTRSQVTVVNSSGNINRLVALSYSEKELKKNDWCQIGAVTTSETAHVAPFNCKIIHITVSYDENDDDSPVKVYKNSSEVHEVTILEDSNPGSSVFDVDITGILKGDRLRVRGGNGCDLDDCVITLYLEEV